MEAKRMRRAAVAELSARSARLPRQTTSTSDLVRRSIVRRGDIYGTIINLNVF